MKKVLTIAAILLAANTWAQPKTIKEKPPTKQEELSDFKYKNINIGLTDKEVVMYFKGCKDEGPGTVLNKNKDTVGRVFVGKLLEHEYSTTYVMYFYKYKAGKVSSIYRTYVREDKADNDFLLFNPWEVVNHEN